MTFGYLDNLPRRRALDSGRFADWLLERGFAEHATRRDEWQSSSCPHCGTGRKAWRFMVNAATGFAHCISCGWGTRSGFIVVAEVDGVSDAEAVALVGRGATAEPEVREVETAAPVSAQPATGKPLRAPDVSGVVWWDGRPESAQGWQANALAALAARGFSFEFLRAKSIGFGELGRVAGRVVLPVFYFGALAWYQAWDYTRTSSIKYQSPPRVEGVIGRRDIVYQIDAYWSAEVFVVAEGMVNAWSAEVVGYPAGCTFGKAITEEQLALLVRMPKLRRLIFAYDPDAADHTKFLAQRLQSLAVGFDVAYCRFADGDDRDLNALGAPLCRATLDAAVPTSWFDRRLPGQPRRASGFGYDARKPVR